MRAARSAVRSAIHWCWGAFSVEALLACGVACTIPGVHTKLHFRLEKMELCSKRTPQQRRPLYVFWMPLLQCHYVL